MSGGGGSTFQKMRPRSPSPPFAFGEALCMTVVCFFVFLPLILSPPSSSSSAASNEHSCSSSLRNVEYSSADTESVYRSAIWNMPSRRLSRGMMRPSSAASSASSSASLLPCEPCGRV